MLSDRNLPASVNNRVVGVARSLEGSTEEFDVELLVLGLVPLRISGLGELSGSKVAIHC